MGATYLLQLSEAGSKAAGVGPVEGTLQMLGLLVVQGLGSPGGHNPGKRICRARWQGHLLAPTVPPQAHLPPKRDAN